MNPVWDDNRSVGLSATVEIPHEQTGGRWRSFEGWRGAKHGVTGTSRQTMTCSNLAAHGRQRSRAGGEEQADATIKESMVCRLGVPDFGLLP